jgi:hypothetical protein
MVSARSLYAGMADAYMRFGNGGTTAYSTKKMSGNGSGLENYNASGSGDMGVWTMGGSNLTAGIFGSTKFYLPNYAGSTDKSVGSESVVENNATDSRLSSGAGLWASTAPITQITLTTANGWAQYTTATLYGVLKA